MTILRRLFSRGGNFRRISVFIVIAAGALLPTPAAAYERDVHYQLMYVLCRLSGFDHPSSLKVASADQALDDNNTTIAVPKFSFQKTWYVERGRRWHALDFSREEVLRQLERLWVRACGVETDDQGASKRVAKPELVYLGQYFHYLQDHYSHRRLDLLDGWPKDDRSPYDPLVGHVFDGGQPDRIPRNVAKAKKMAHHTAASLHRFASECLGTPHAPVPPDLIDALIDQMKTAYGEPRRDGISYDEADLKTSRMKLQELLDRWLREGTIPQRIRVPEWDERIEYRFDIAGNTRNAANVEKKWSRIQPGTYAVPEREQKPK